MKTALRTLVRAALHVLTHRERATNRILAPDAEPQGSLFFIPETIRQLEHSMLFGTHRRDGRS